MLHTHTHTHPIARAILNDDKKSKGFTILDKRRQISHDPKHN